ncbi:DJ-1/PfpI family protein [Capillimicrobium parvum]|uniref:Isonitrile hydratase n=1 Tax=Capillimicrobium parvum TaxID=2884022 RepID=A0A9E6Y0I5_9ACTN|nr:DJ-1/PfpI family protein [Capillimicrobium parvum]UGS37706.1 Isonitrile hydratase [Capillimicrobium parvum]
MDIAIPLYDRFTALDAIGPYEVLSRLPGAQVHWIGHEARPYATDRGLRVVADATLEELPHPDVVVVPGGTGTVSLLEDERLLDWIRTAHETSQWTTSVCTGSLLLGAAGMLEGLRATSHFLYLDRLATFGAQVTDQRVIEQGRIITAAGVSSGIDMALHLASRIAGETIAQAIQLVIEYDPAPPFDAGHPAKVDPEIVELVRRRARVPA